MDVDEPVIHTPEPRQWVCQGSDKEIQEEAVQSTRPLV